MSLTILHCAFYRARRRVKHIFTVRGLLPENPAEGGSGRGKPRQKIGRGKLHHFYRSRCTHRELQTVDTGTHEVVLTAFEQ